MMSQTEVMKIMLGVVMKNFVFLLVLFLSACQEQEAITLPVSESSEPVATPKKEPIAKLTSELSADVPSIASTWVKPQPKSVPAWGVKPSITSAKYICSQNGSDRNDGSLQSPYETVERGLKDLHKGHNLLLCRGGYWERDEHLSINAANSEEFVYIGAYGEGDDPHLKFKEQGILIQHSSNIYIEDIILEGQGRRSGAPKGQGWIIGAGTSNIVLDGIQAHKFRVGVVAGGDENFILRNSEIYNNSSTGFYGGFKKGTFVHENKAWLNGGGYTEKDGTHAGGGGHNYYLAGHWNVDTHDYVFQKNLSKDAAPQYGPDGGKCERGAIVTHGYIRDLYFVDNRIIEKKGNSGGGCWGAPIDAGRNEAWGVESFPNLTYTGNHVEYTGNLLLGLTNADNALVGWNSGIVDATQQGVGFAAPNRANEDVETKIKNLTVVHNNFHIVGEVLWNSTGIRLNNIGGVLENNIVTFDTPQRKVYCYWLQTGDDHLVIEGKASELLEYGDNNTCYYSTSPSF